MNTISYRFHGCELQSADEKPEIVSGAVVIGSCRDGWRVIAVSVDYAVTVSDSLRNQIVRWLHTDRDTAITAALKHARRNGL